MAGAVIFLLPRPVLAYPIHTRGVSPLPRPALRGVETSEARTERVGVRGCFPVKTRSCGKRRASPLTPKSLPSNFDLSPPKSGEREGSAHFLKKTSLPHPLALP